MLVRTAVVLALLLGACSTEPDPADPFPDASDPTDVPAEAPADADAGPGDPADAPEASDDVPEAPADAPDTADTADAPAAAETDTGPAPTSAPVEVLVLLDDEPSPDTRVVQGGNFETHWFTDAQGMASIEIDLTVPGDHYVMASHPEARNHGAHHDPASTEPMVIELTRFDPSDNPDYVFKDPGEPDKSHIIEKCAHCHDTINRTWFDSAHRTSANNAQLLDLYPDVKALGTTGACADCHAPGIDGELGGRDLDEAEGYAHDYGVHCEVCHHIESVHMDEPAGVAGRLHVVRPSQLAPFEGVGKYLPLMFCPDHDTANFYMGCVQRDHFRQAEICGGCHELLQPALAPELAPDPARWPDGTLPIHTSYSEWLEDGPGAIVPCQVCHMEPAGDEVLNTADLHLWGLGNTGVSGGWPRPPGNTRLHTFAGPRSPEEDRLSPPIDLSVALTNDGSTVTATVTVTAAGAGHAVPTGEPMRSIAVVVEAICGDPPLTAIGGDVIPSFGGYLARKAAGEDWTVWPGAQPGQVVRVVNHTDAFHDYTGHGPFGDGTFDAAAKGLPVAHHVGEARVATVDGDTVTFDTALPEGDVAYLAEEPVDIASRAAAGQPGFAFARVLTDADDNEMVPHYRATDVTVDNRLLPGEPWTSTHLFAAEGCATPTVTATALYRALPPQIARARGWELRDHVMAVAHAE